VKLKEEIVRLAEQDATRVVRQNMSEKNMKGNDLIYSEVLEKDEVLKKD
jgi:hypothetical protein